MGLTFEISIPGFLDKEPLFLVNKVLRIQLWPPLVMWTLLSFTCRQQKEKERESSGNRLLHWLTRWKMLLLQGQTLTTFPTHLHSRIPTSLHTWTTSLLTCECQGKKKNNPLSKVCSSQPAIPGKEERKTFIHESHTVCYSLFLSSLTVIHRNYICNPMDGWFSPWNQFFAASLAVSDPLAILLESKRQRVTAG